jgi:multidrug efflux pump subunit AcrA (membrane-fusion protein)
MVDESDIGKISAGLPVTVTVTSYPNQPFEGVVAKIEPQALAEQTVTTFSVLIILDNESGLLRPGMNADVEIRIAERRDVIAVPTVALRTDSDIRVSGGLVGLSPAEVNAMLRDSEPARTPTAGEDGEDGYRFESRYWVFVDEPSGPRAVNVITGLTDLDYSEVLAGLEDDDRVLLLPSSGLILAQKRFQAQMSRFMGMPGMSGDSDKKKGKKKSSGSD